jgi:hypothetical protein
VEAGTVQREFAHGFQHALAGENQGRPVEETEQVRVMEDGAEESSDDLGPAGDVFVALFPLRSGPLPRGPELLALATRKVA